MPIVRRGSACLKGGPKAVGMLLEAPLDPGRFTAEGGSYQLRSRLLASSFPVGKGKGT
jgi:hypothetical protein